MVQTRSSTRRNNIETNRNHSSNHINSQVLNTMHLVRPSTGESSSGDSNISSPPGYNENIIQNQENRTLIISENERNQADDDLPTYNESQYLLEPNIETINYEVPELENFQYFKNGKTKISDYEIYYLYNSTKFKKFYNFRDIISILTLINFLLLFIFLNNDFGKSNSDNTGCSFSNKNVNDSSLTFNVSYTKTIYSTAIFICVISILYTVLNLSYFLYADSIVAIQKINILNINKIYNKTWLIVNIFNFILLLINILIVLNLDKDCDINYIIYTNIAIKLLVIYCYNLINNDLKAHLYLTKIKNLNYDNSLEQEDNIIQEDNIRRTDIIDEEIEPDE